MHHLLTLPLAISAKHFLIWLQKLYVMATGFYKFKLYHNPLLLNDLLPVFFLYIGQVSLLTDNLSKYMYTLQF
jgi:hypothetical protein